MVWYNALTTSIEQAIEVGNEMASSRLWIGVIASLLAALTALSCGSDNEQTMALDCDITETFDNHLEGQAYHLGRAYSADIVHPGSEAWRCELLATAGYTRQTTREEMYFDGTILADGLVEAAYARTWPDAQLKIGEALERAMGPDGIEKFSRMVTEDFERLWSTDEQD